MPGDPGGIIPRDRGIIRVLHSNRQARKRMPPWTLTRQLKSMSPIVIAGSTRVPRVATSQRGVVLVEFQLSCRLCFERDQLLYQ